MKLRAILILLTIFTSPLYAQDGPGKWESTIQQFEEQDKANPPGEGVVLFTGSSSIAMWKDVASYFPEYKVLNLDLEDQSFLTYCIITTG